MKSQELQGVLQQSSLHTLLMVTSKMLSQIGFGDVQILDRREARQKSRLGGHELVCLSTTGTITTKVVVKVINDVVRLRMLDEHAGTVLRTRADYGLIVSPHRVASSVMKSKDAHMPVRVRVMDGAELSFNLARLGIGVRSFGDVDYQYFASLEEYSERVLEFVKSDLV